MCGLTLIASQNRFTANISDRIYHFRQKVLQFGEIKFVGVTDHQATQTIEAQTIEGQSIEAQTIKR